MKILGISAFYHDSAAALIDNENIIAAAQEERFTRKKHDPSFPTQAIKYCLEYSGLSIEDLDAIVFYEKPLLKFERLLETYYRFAPHGLLSFLKAIPVWLREKLFLKKIIRDELYKIERKKLSKLKIYFSEHHLSHAASAFYPSPFKKAAIVTIDGVGEWATASISYGEDVKITKLRELRFPHSLGLLYSSFTYFLGFRVNSGEYKLMGLAPYGNPDSENTIRYKNIIETELIKINDDGSIILNLNYFKYPVGLKMIYEKKWENIFHLKQRKNESDPSQEHCDLALAIQQVTEDIVIKMISEAKRLTNADYLCLAGGVALNCVANGKILKSGIFKKIFIQPASGDAGGALGAALATNYIYFNNERKTNANDSMQGAYLGPEYSNKEIVQTAKRYKAVYNEFSNKSDLFDIVAQKISEGKVIGWFNGRMEFGPRALGNRSILGDPSKVDMQKKLNMKIKYRESFRPFAPCVLEEDIDQYFDLSVKSPYMLLVAQIKKDKQEKLPDNYFELPLRDKLYYKRSDLPAITHIDFSARVQSVNKSTNREFWELIKAFKSITGYGIVVNTSFNVRGEPIVCSPEDAYLCFMNTEMDILVMNNFYFEKKNQIADNKLISKNNFILD